MLQDYRMFSGSILENIAAGRDLEMEEVLAVLDTIGMGDFVKALPMGIHTVVGESTTAFWWASSTHGACSRASRRPEAADF